MSDRDKLLTDAKAAADPAAVRGVADGQAPLDEAHTPTSVSFDTGALYRDTATFGSTGGRAAASNQDTQG